MTGSSQSGRGAWKRARRSCSDRTLGRRVSLLVAGEDRKRHGLRRRGGGKWKHVIRLWQVELQIFHAWSELCDDFGTLEHQVLSNLDADEAQAKQKVIVSGGWSIVTCLEKIQT